MVTPYRVASGYAARVSAPSTYREHLHAVAALSVLMFLLCTGTPGFSAWDHSTLADERAQENIIRQQGPLIGQTAIALADLNRRFRLPIARRLNKIEQLFRIRQKWQLYTSGPKHAHRLEVWLDEALVYQTQSRDHAWLRPQLSHRKLRPMVDSLAAKETAFNWKGMGRFLLLNAREDFPEATTISIVATRARFGEPDSAPTHGQWATATGGWALSPIPEAHLPDSTP